MTKINEGRYGKGYSKVLTKNFLIEEYVNKKRSPYDIAKEIGCCAKSIYNYLEFHNIDVLNLDQVVKTNSKYNKLTTLEITKKSKNGTNIWKCKCDCGNISYVRSSQLINERVKSCGCIRRYSKSNNQRWTGYCDVSGSLLCDIKLRAKKKNFEFDLDAKFLYELLIKQNKKCSLTGLDIDIDNNASLDRIDSSKGYIKENVQWVHKDVNKMKMDLDINYFIKMCNIVSKYNE